MCGLEDVQILSLVVKYLSLSLTHNSRDMWDEAEDGRMRSLVVAVFGTEQQSVRNDWTAHVFVCNDSTIGVPSQEDTSMRRQ